MSYIIMRGGHIGRDGSVSLTGRESNVIPSTYGPIECISSSMSTKERIESLARDTCGGSVVWLESSKCLLKLAADFAREVAGDFDSYVRRRGYEGDGWQEGYDAMQGKYIDAYIWYLQQCGPKWLREYI